MKSPTLSVLVGDRFKEVVRASCDLVVVIVLGFFYVLEAVVRSLIPNSWIMKPVIGEVVVITGAGGGVGRQLALRFARLGARVVLWDINEEGVRETERQVRDAGGAVWSYVVDLSKKAEVYNTAERVKREVGTVSILTNNAGVVFGKTLLNLTDQQIEKTFQVNILSHYWTTRAFLGDMMKMNHGHIVTVGSVTGLMGTYLCTDYSATKFATVGFHESLFTELRVHGYDGIHTTLICPYFINTGMFAGTNPRLLPMLEPAHVANDIVEAVLTNQVMVTLPSSVRYFAPLKGILPAKLCWAIMYRLIQGPQAMMGFKGSTIVVQK